MEKPEEKVLNLATLVFPVRGGRVLLAEKTKKIGKGFLNGWGGGVEDGEDVLSCATREFFEETGGVVVDKKDLQKVAIAHFKNNMSDQSVFKCTVHVYIANNWKGHIVSTDEMRNPEWYSISSIPKGRLMPADQFWLPRVLQGETGIVTAEYAPYQERLIGEVVFKPVLF